MEDCTIAFIVITTAVICSAPSWAHPLEISKSGQQCLFDGKWYRANSSFVTSDCTMQCYCMSNGSTSCMELCSPLSQGICPVGMTARNHSEPAGPRGSQCFCIRRYCVADYCLNEKTFQKYKVGESFKRGNCSEKCICTNQGRFKCTPVCPKMQCPPGFKRKDSKKRVKYLADGCSCPKQRCIPKRRRACKYNGRIYTTKRYFETNNCQSKCRCKRNGVIKCMPLCPSPKGLKCGANEKLSKTYVKALAKGKCQCPKHVCVPRVAVAQNNLKLSKMKKIRYCRIGNKTLVPGQLLITSDCSDRCRCTTLGHLVCLPLCMSPPNTCSSNEERLLVRRPVPGSQCSCTRVICRPKKSSDTPNSRECKADGHVFRQDIDYIDKSCTKRCRCSKTGQALCSSLCPVNDPEYCHNGYPEHSKQRVSGAPWCSCAIKRCIPYRYHDNRSVNEQ